MSLHLSSMLSGIHRSCVSRFFFPDSPTTAWFLTPTERVVAVARIRVNQTGIENKRFKASQYVSFLNLISHSGRHDTVSISEHTSRCRCGHSRLDYNIITWQIFVLNHMMISIAYERQTYTPLLDYTRLNLVLTRFSMALVCRLVECLRDPKTWMWFLYAAFSCVYLISAICNVCTTY